MNSPHLAPIHHRVQQGDALEGGYPAGIITRVYEQFTQVLKNDLFYPPIDPSRCLLIRRSGLSKTSRLIGSGQPNHPSKRSPGQKDELTQNRLQPAGTSISTIPSSPDTGRSADRGRGGKTTPGKGQAWSSTNPRGQWRTGKNGGNWLQNHLWYPNDPHG